MWLNSVSGFLSTYKKRRLFWNLGDYIPVMTPTPAAWQVLTILEWMIQLRVRRIKREEVQTSGTVSCRRVLRRYCKKQVDSPSTTELRRYVLEEDLLSINVSFKSCFTSRERVTLHETIPIWPNEALTFCSDRVPVPFKHLNDDCLWTTGSPFFMYLTCVEWPIGK